MTDKIKASLAEIQRHAQMANETIRLRRHGRGNGRIKVATCVHHIQRLADAALLTYPPAAAAPVRVEIGHGGYSVTHGAQPVEWCTSRKAALEVAENYARTVGADLFVQYAVPAE